MAKIGALLRARRLEAKMSVRQLSNKLAVPESTIYKYEAGKTEPNFDTLRGLAITLNVSLDELFNLPSHVSKRQEILTPAASECGEIIDKFTEQEKGWFLTMLQGYTITREMLRKKSNVSEEYLKMIR